MYTQKGNLDDVHYNNCHDWPDGTYGVAVNAALFPTQGQSGSPYLINFEGPGVPTIIAVHTGVCTDEEIQDHFSN